jgi:hypothetical protein
MPHVEKSGGGMPQPAEGSNPWSEAAAATMPMRRKRWSANVQEGQVFGLVR